MKCPFSRTSAIAWSISPLIEWYCATMSISGMGFCVVLVILTFTTPLVNQASCWLAWANRKFALLCGTLSYFLVLLQVTCAAALASSSFLAIFIGKTQLDPTLAHPAAYPGRVAVQKCIIGNVASDDRTGANDGVLSNCVAANDCRVGANCSAALPQSLLVFLFAVHVPARVHDVGKDH